MNNNYKTDPNFMREPTDQELFDTLKHVQYIDAEQENQLNQQLSTGASLRASLLAKKLVTEEELESIDFGVRLLNAAVLNRPQLAIALYDERTMGVRAEESLRVRGWLPPIV
jgi:hypothetical protein